MSCSSLRLLRVHSRSPPSLSSFLFRLALIGIPTGCLISGTPRPSPLTPHPSPLTPHPLTPYLLTYLVIILSSITASCSSTQTERLGCYQIYIPLLVRPPRCPITSKPSSQKIGLAHCKSTHPLRCRSCPPIPRRAGFGMVRRTRCVHASQQSSPSTSPATISPASPLCGSIWQLASPSLCLVPLCWLAFLHCRSGIRGMGQNTPLSSPSWTRGFPWSCSSA